MIATDLRLIDGNYDLEEDNKEETDADVFLQICGRRTHSSNTGFPD